MMKNEVYLKNVAESLALLSKQVELLNTVNLYDINIIAEDFFAKLLNLIFDYKLKNINVIEKNAPAIDLIDEENKISIQVTSDNSNTKIKHTINEYIDKKAYEKFDRLIILILTTKKNYSKPFDTNNLFTFNKESDILDVKNLIKFIRGLEIKKIKEINDFLGRELCDQIYLAKKTQANEIDTIIDLIEYISKHKEVKKKIDVEIDPKYKIFKRFKNFTERLITEYTTLYTLYGDAVETINETIGIDEAQDIIIMFYLQDISMQFLDETNDNPVNALNKLVGYFEDKLSVNGKKYDRSAIKFYLVNEMIKCRVFPNERNEYNGGK